MEFVYPNVRATFNQREQGTDFDCFSSGLRAAALCGKRQNHSGRGNAG